jgi:hypothetical protein
LLISSPNSSSHPFATTSCFLHLFSQTCIGVAVGGSEPAG